MFDQLVESKNSESENKSRSSYLLMTFGLVAVLCLGAVLYSLFAKDFGMGHEEFELSAVVAPIPITNAPVQKQEKRQPPQTKNEIITRQTNMMRVEESQSAPDKISVVPITQKSRPNGYFLTKDGLETELQNSSPNSFGRGDSGDGIGLEDTQPTKLENNEKVILPPPPIKKLVEESKEKRTIAVSGGVVNGQAISLPKPQYPLAAKAIHASGAVNVQVTIDEEGKVISAKAIDGQPLLRAAAEQAAWNAKFKPTLLTGQRAKVTGLIAYKFSMQ